MDHSRDRLGERWFCPQCPRYATPGDGPQEIEQHEQERIAVLALLDAALDEVAPHRTADRQITDEMEATMGQTIQTRGCSKCGGTMYRTVDVDEHGNPISVPQFVCNSCGNVEG
ncbi:hypothetical protein [Streptomyces sp. NPDC059991]|uniref:hypothetical protein n=1 Tax=unclassified Streptomyces TaxID=2593676 RepID=UPI0036CF1533